MAKIAGVDVLLKIEDDLGELIVVGGQTGATLNRDANTIDTTDKTSGGWTSSLVGNKSWSVDADGFVVLGDNAFSLIEDAFNNGNLISAEVRLGANDNADGITYAGQGHLTSLPLEFAQDDAVTFSLSLEGATPLTSTVGSVTVV